MRRTGASEVYVKPGRGNGRFGHPLGPVVRSHAPTVCDVRAGAVVVDNGTMMTNDTMAPDMNAPMPATSNTTSTAVTAIAISKAEPSPDIASASQGEVGIGPPAKRVSAERTSTKSAEQATSALGRRVPAFEQRQQARRLIREHDVEHLEQVPGDARHDVANVLGYDRPTRLKPKSALLVGLVMPELVNPIFPAFAQVIEDPGIQGGAAASAGVLHGPVRLAQHLDDVGGRALDWRVDGGALHEGALLRVLGVDLRVVRLAAEDGRHIAVGAGEALRRDLAGGRTLRRRPARISAPVRSARPVSASRPCCSRRGC